MGRPMTMVSDSICKDPRTANSVRIFEGDAGIDGPPNRSDFLKATSKNPRTAESVGIFQGNAGIPGKRNRSEFSKRDP